MISVRGNWRRFAAEAWTEKHQGAISQPPGELLCVTIKHSKAHGDYWHNQHWIKLEILMSDTGLWSVEFMFTG